MSRVLWVLQVAFGLYFVAVGIMHFVVPPGLPAMMAWMYDLPTGLHVVAGVAEILGGIGLILPSLTRVRPQLTVYAALGLAAVMIGATLWHLGREETTQIGLNVISLVILLFIAYGRWRLSPIGSRSSA